MVGGKQRTLFGGDGDERSNAAEKKSAVLQGYCTEMSARPYDPLVGRHRHPIALPYVGNGVGRAGLPMDTLR